MEPGVTLDYIVTDKNVTTGRGMGAATDFALELIRVLQGEDKAKEMAEKSYFIAKKKPKNHRNIKKSLAFLKRVCYTR